MIGRTNAGGSGASLNYRLVGGTTQPANPSENTIWVNTSEAITSHVFASEQPTGTAGMVWIKTGKASPVSMSVTKKNPVWVYPMSCQQYVGGAWVVKAVRSYFTGTWHDWMLYLYTPGDIHEDLTGGFEAKAIKCAADFDGNNLDGAFPTITYNTDKLSVSLSNGTAYYNKSGSMLTVGKIDLTGYSSLTFRYASNFQGGYATFYVSQSNTQSPIAASDLKELVRQSSTNAELTLDVSGLSGEYYVGVNLATGGVSVVTNTVDITEIVLS